MADLEGREDELTGNLSVGWKQRLALGCATIHEPKLIFLDEPTSGVDPNARRQFWELLYDLANQGVTLFVTTHYMDEATHCNRLAFIYRGNIIADGTPQEIKAVLAADTILQLEVADGEEALAALKDHPLVVEAYMQGSLLNVNVGEHTAEEADVAGFLGKARVRGHARRAGRADARGRIRAPRRLAGRASVMACATAGCAHRALSPYFAEFVEGRRGEILDAALAVFGEKGYEAGTMREIAAQVGVSEPAIYRHYASKEAILADIVATAGDRIAGEMHQGLRRCRREQHRRRCCTSFIEMRRARVEAKRAARKSAAEGGGHARGVAQRARAA